MEMTDTVLIPPLFVAFNTIFSFVQPTTALNWSLFFTIVDIVRYGTYASWDFQDALNLYIFSIKYAPGHLKCRNGPCGLYFHALNKEDVLRYARANLPAGYDGIITIDLE
ncbi:uncharacterized protein N7529_012169 [Penicillium soppii]|uniref:uncharacterized protein n=1 Tax=Penicillium soppii TaxID=69789 RepID=UPI002549BB93|nr:uncharacterized protein N7529_012169 [Penicillium soppii]KAJ5852784.1 hypothetical protein N7529_012169 [Penicillium soppii]